MSTLPDIPNAPANARIKIDLVMRRETVKAWLVEPEEAGGQAWLPRSVAQRSECGRSSVLRDGRWYPTHTFYMPLWLYRQIRRKLSPVKLK